MKKHLCILLILIPLLCLQACDPDEDDSTGSLYGYVYYTYSDYEDTKILIALAGAEITIDALGISTTADNDGRYTLGNINPGDYTVKCIRDGYLEATITITIIADEQVERDFITKPEDTGWTIYVAPHGNDSNNGSLRQPMENPGFAAQFLEPGDTLFLLLGDYYIRDDEDGIIRPPAGTAEKWITIKGGGMSSLYATNNLYAVIDISESSYIKIEDLNISGEGNAPARDAIVGVGADLNYVILDNLTIDCMNEFGVNIGDVNHIEIHSCDITGCGFGSIGGPEGEYGGWRNAYISNCDLSYGGHYYAGGQNPYSRPDGFGIEESDGPIEIYNTLAEHNKGDGLDSKARNTYIHHCTVANNSCDGVKLWGGGSKIENVLIYGTGDSVAASSPWAGIVIGTDEEGADFEIINVTLHDNETREAYPIYVQYDDDATITLLLRNTIIAGGYGHSYFGDSVILAADHNIFYSPYRYDQVYANGILYTYDNIHTLGEGNLSLDPMFDLPAWGYEGFYTVMDGSPAIDAGTSLGAPWDDLDGILRPQGEEYDIGAYER